MDNMKKILFALAALLSLAACNSNEPAPATDGKAIVESIMTRTSIRDYTDQAISADTVETLLRAGMAAPSAVNKQPWHFIVVNKKEKLMELASTNPYAKMLEKAPLAIVVCGDMSKALEGDVRAFWVQDCSAATENILLAAHALGLGAVWTGLYPNMERVNAVSEVLNLTDNIIPLCTVVIGYPAEQPAACGAADKPAEQPAACGAADKPAEEKKPAACGAACGAGDK